MPRFIETLIYFAYFDINTKEINTVGLWQFLGVSFASGIIIILLLSIDKVLNQELIACFHIFREKMEAQLEKESRMLRLHATSHNYSHDSAIDTDMQEWDSEVMDIDLVNNIFSLIHCERASQHLQHPFRIYQTAFVFL